MTDERTELERQFDARMSEIYRQAKDECGYVATRFAGMLAEHGGIETAKRLLRPGQEYASGLTTLWERRCLHLSVERQVLEPEFAPLFSEQQLDTARRCLKELDYEVEAS
ncbi:hypothetical protein [Candidatus Palauibacter sp.]|uniref:hypothetical protein n=1 Tax=Candidatus Palauibacter sp. TaxID=3101350 RepID=UPI003B5C5392